MQNRTSSIIATISVLVIIAILISFHYYAHMWVSVFDKHESIEFTALVFLATAVLAIIAYVELTRANSITENEFLLNISNKWGSPSIIRARRVLHNLFVDAYRSKKHKQKCKSCRYKDAMNDVAEAIFALRTKKGVEGKKFIDLLNLLDFMEIVGFFWERKNIKTEDIDGLFGNSILFFYLSFLTFIENRQKYEENYFINFCNLSRALQKRTKMSICLCK